MMTATGYTACCENRQHTAGAQIVVRDRTYNERDNSTLKEDGVRCPEIRDLKEVINGERVLDARRVQGRDDYLLIVVCERR